MAALLHNHPASRIAFSYDLEFDQFSLQLALHILFWGAQRSRLRAGPWPGLNAGLQHSGLCQICWVEPVGSWLWSKVGEQTVIRGLGDYLMKWFADLCEWGGEKELEVPTRRPVVSGYLHKCPGVGSLSARYSEHFDMSTSIPAVIGLLECHVTVRVLMGDSHWNTLMDGYTDV